MDIQLNSTPTTSFMYKSPQPPRKTYHQCTVPSIQSISQSDEQTPLRVEQMQVQSPKPSQDKPSHLFFVPTRFEVETQQDKTELNNNSIQISTPIISWPYQTKTKKCRRNAMHTHITKVLGDRPR